MTDIRQKFIHWYYNEFQLDPLYVAMVSTVEDSPWHRERNVGVHTDMVVSQYLATSTPFDVRGAIGCAFHDVGKPPALVVKFKPERGNYNAFHGHEQVSARMWENWAVKNWNFLNTELGLETKDIYTIGWMIEHHVPWATKKDAKLNAFATTAFKTLGHSSAWTDMLMADQTGRMSDDSHQRLEECSVWIADHVARRNEAEQRDVQCSEKTVFMLVGAPACGKSTYRKTLLNSHPDAVIVSMDDLRLSWYSGSYDEAFIASTMDKSFGAKVDKFYIEVLRQYDTIVLDNTNTVAKSRNRWVAPAHARQFKIVAVLFPVDLKTVRARQSSRDKFVPLNVVDGMYNRMQLPMYGDFDDVIVHDGNL